jgi:hypothetical protein
MFFKSKASAARAGDAATTRSASECTASLHLDGNCSAGDCSDCARAADAPVSKNRNTNITCVKGRSRRDNRIGLCETHIRATQASAEHGFAVRNHSTRPNPPTPRAVSTVSILVLHELSRNEKPPAGWLTSASSGESIDAAVAKPLPSRTVRRHPQGFCRRAPGPASHSLEPFHVSARGSWPEIQAIWNSRSLAVPPPRTLPSTHHSGRKICRRWAPS